MVDNDRSYGESDAPPENTRLTQGTLRCGWTRASVLDDLDLQRNDQHPPTLSELLARIAIIVPEENVRPMPRPKTNWYPYTSRGNAVPSESVDISPHPSNIKQDATINVGDVRFFLDTDDMPPPMALPVEISIHHM